MLSFHRLGSAILSFAFRVVGTLANQKQKGPNFKTQDQNAEDKGGNNEGKSFCYLCGRHHSKKQGCSLVDIMNI